MGLIARESIQAVLDACDMLEIIAPYTTLKKSGASYMGRCPFHGEKTPSFSVDPVQKLYYCFGCGEGGNVFKFIQQKEGLDFADSVKLLADKYGVRLQFDQDSPGWERKRRGRERLLALLDSAAGYYHRVLLKSSSAAAARSYIEKRGFSKETIKNFRLGYSPVKGSSLIRAAVDKGYSLEELLRAGLAQDGRGGKIDRFRGRLMFPFTDHRGRVLGFGARVLGDDKPKYLNSPETELYRKSSLVFGLGSARAAIARLDHVYIVEGYTDVLALSQTGILNAVASMGTSLTEQQLREISRFSKKVYLCFDADAAGRMAMLRAMELAKSLDLQVKVVEIPGDEDPAEFIFSQGAEAFKKLAAVAPGLLKYQVQAALSSCDLDSSEGRVQAFKSLGPVIAGAANSIERDEQLRVIADRLRLSHENVAYLMKSALTSENEKYGSDARRRVLSREEITERSFLSLCLARGEEAGRYLELINEAHFTTGINRSAFLWIRERLEGDHSGSSLAAPDDLSLPETGELSKILPELHIRSITENFAPEALPELFMKLCESELYRRIGALKEQLSCGGDVSLEELYKLENYRREILRKIHSGSYESV